VALHGSKTWVINKREGNVRSFINVVLKEIQRIWTEKKRKILKTIDEKRTLIDTIKKRR